LTGRSALVSVSGARSREALLRSSVFQHRCSRTTTGAEYPRSLMGTVAHARQFLLDAQHNRRLWERFEKAGGQGKRPRPMPAGRSVRRSSASNRSRSRPTRATPSTALDFAAEFDLQLVLLGVGTFARVADRLKQEKVPVLLRISTTDQPRHARRGSFVSTRRRRTPMVSRPCRSV
jgi:hypothetical protein